ncbi:MAG: hypothetical protein ACREQE_11375 [Candidatus Binataceae bacterium]
MRTADSLRILVVDDNGDSADSLTILQLYDAIVESAGDGLTVLAIAPRFAPPAFGMTTVAVIFPFTPPDDR